MELLVARGSVLLGLLALAAGCHRVFPFEAGTDVGTRGPDGARSDGARSDGARSESGALDRLRDQLADAIPPPPVEWVKQLGGAMFDVGRSIAVDGAGNIYLCGGFSGTADFGGGSVTSKAEDVFIASYTATGAHRWSKVLGGTVADSAKGIAVDTAGNVHVTGDFQYTADFGVGTLTSVGANSPDIFVASYTALGAPRWAHRAGDEVADTGKAAAVDAQGNAYFAGSFQRSADFGGGALTNGGPFDMFIASLDSSGTHRWSRGFGGPSYDHSYAVAVDGGGNVYLAGDFTSAVDFGGGSMTGGGWTDGCLASFDFKGAHRWSKRFGGTGQESGEAVAVDGSGNVYLAGMFYSATVNLGGGDLVNAGASDIVIASFTQSGTLRWSRRLGGAQSDMARGLAVDDRGNLYLTGSFSGTIDLGGKPLGSASQSDIFVASYSTASGAHRWSMRFGGGGADDGMAVAASGASLVVTGSFMQTVSFGGTQLTANGSAGDIFVLRLAAP